MLTETATLPRAIQVMMLEKLPPGQAATSIMPRASIGSMRSAQQARQVSAGSRTNCASRPITGALGSRTIRLKSSRRRSNETPNIITARMMLISTRLLGSNWIFTGSITGFLRQCGCWQRAVPPGRRAGYCCAARCSDDSCPCARSRPCAPVAGTDSRRPGVRRRVRV